MRHRFFITLLSVIATTNFSQAQGIDTLINALAAMPDYSAQVRYAVTLPQAEDDVVYTIQLRQPADPDSYLIDWTVDSPSGTVTGFTAWFSGHFYNFRNRRLQEHHEQWDAAAPQGAKALQNSAQFASLLPSRIAMQLRDVAAGGYDYKVRKSGDEIIVDAVRNLAGEPDAELSWTFSASDLTPRVFYADYNPGAISGQQVKAEYSPLEPIAQALDEEFLRERYPDAFERFRESQFAIENMRGETLPAFSLPRVDGGRLARQAADQFDYPTVVVLLDPESPLAPDLVAALRGAVNRLPQTANIIWACSSKNPDVAAELLGNMPPEETALCAAGSLATDCGAATLPVVMVCGRDGKIADLIIGMNNTVESDVMQMLTRL